MSIFKISMLQTNYHHPWGDRWPRPAGCSVGGAESRMSASFISVSVRGCLCTPTKEEIWAGRLAAAATSWADILHPSSHVVLLSCEVQRRPMASEAAMESVGTEPAYLLPYCGHNPNRAPAIPWKLSSVSRYCFLRRALPQAWIHCEIWAMPSSVREAWEMTGSYCPPTSIHPPRRGGSTGASTHSDRAGQAFWPTAKGLQRPRASRPSPWLCDGAVHARNAARQLHFGVAHSGVRTGEACDVASLELLARRRAS